MPKQVSRLSFQQLMTLLYGIDKLFRSGRQWVPFDTGEPRWETLEEMGPRKASCSTVRSLWRLGLLDANFTDPRAFGSNKEAKNVKTVPGANTYPPGVPKLYVQTNDQGKIALLLHGIVEPVDGDVPLSLN